MIFGRPIKKFLLGLLYLVCGVVYSRDSMEILSSGYTPNLDTIGIGIIAISAAIFFLISGIHAITDSACLLPIVSRSQYAWYASSVGFIVRAIAMFLGDTYPLPDPILGIQYIIIAIIFFYIGHENVFGLD
ncbi:MAG: hypothetical protein Q7S19_01065 [bacterium]|nr:hypothetical protein [bacterium]